MTTTCDCWHSNQCREKPGCALAAYLPTRYEDMCYHMHQRNQRTILIHETDGDFND